MNSTMKTTPYADSFAGTEITQIVHEQTQSVLTDSAWVCLAPLLLLLTFMWLLVAVFLGWW